MATNFVANCGKINYSPYTYRSVIPKRMGYRLANLCIYTPTNCSTWFKKIMTIASVLFDLKWGRK